MNIRTLVSISLITTTSIVLMGCTPKTPTPDRTPQPEVVTEKSQDTATSDHGKALKIVTTFPPLYAHTANLIDENDTLTNLVPPGTSIHTWQPKPSDVIAMQEADIIVTNGLSLEEFLADYLSDLETEGVRIVDTSIGVPLLEFAEEEDTHDDHDDHDEDEDHHDEEHTDDHHEDEHEDNEDDHDEDEHTDEHDEDEHHEHSDEDEHADEDHSEDDNDDHQDDDEGDHHHHEGPDPHIWLDTTNATIQVTNIAEALSEVDPSQADVYADNVSNYTVTLLELNESIMQMIDPQQAQPFIVFHDAYQYFLTAYGLTDRQVGFVHGFHGDSPSQKQIAELIATITSEGIQTIFTEPQFNPSVITRLEQETVVVSKEIDPIGSSLDKDGYITTMMHLAEAFAG